MKAIQIHEFGQPQCMRLEEIPEPEPKATQAVVHIHAAGVNPVDAYIRSGTYHIQPKLPYTPGMDAAGIVESVGDEIRRVKPGDRVFLTGSITGTYAERALCEQNQIHPLPANLSFSQGACIHVPYTAAAYALFYRAQALPGETVLVHGATGGVGIAAVQLALSAGMTVIGTGGTEEGRGLVLEQGAHHVLNHHDTQYTAKVLELTEGRGVDIILEMLANINLGRDLEMLARDGRVVVIGSRGTVEINPRDAMMRNASILGMLVMNANVQEKTKIYSAILNGLTQGRLRPVVREELPLAQAPRAHQLIMESRARGKIVLIP